MKFQLWADDEKGRPHLMCVVHDDPMAIDYICTAMVNQYHNWHMWTEMLHTGKKKWKRTWEWKDGKEISPEND